MTTQTRILTLLATALFLVGFGCSDNTRNLDTYQNYSSGFGVYASEPGIGDVNVATNAAIRAAFTTAVKPESLVGAYTLTKYVGNNVEDVTDLLSAPQMAASNTMVIFSPVTLLPDNANYKLSLASTIQSVGGNSMSSPFDLTFSTGNGASGGYGIVSIPGQPPVFQSMAKSWDADECLWANVTFDQSLIEAPQGTLKIKGPLGNTLWEGATTFTKLYDGETQVWKTFVSCNCAHLGAWTKIFVTINRAIDYDEEEMTPPTTKNFEIKFMEGPCA